MRITSTMPLFQARRIADCALPMPYEVDIDDAERFVVILVRSGYHDTDDIPETILRDFAFVAMEKPLSRDPMPHEELNDDWGR